jgi:hypothetical protein
VAACVHLSQYSVLVARQSALTTTGNVADEVSAQPKGVPTEVGEYTKGCSARSRGAQQSEELTSRGEGPQNTCLRQRTRTDRHVQPKANPILRGDEQRKGGSRVGGVGSRTDGSRGGKGDDAAVSFPRRLAIRQRGGYFRVLVTMTGRAMDRKTSGKALPDLHTNQQPQVQFSLGGGRGGEKRTDQSERGKQLDCGGRGTRSG